MRLVVWIGNKRRCDKAMYVEAASMRGDKKVDTEVVPGSLGCQQPSQVMAAFAGTALGDHTIEGAHSPLVRDFVVTCKKLAGDGFPEF
jgi:hypothetical protein